MKCFFRAILISLTIFIAAPLAQADVMVGVEIPLAYQFKEADDGSRLNADGRPSGFMFLAQLPLVPLGAGLESYEITLDEDGEHALKLVMADAFFILPVPVVNIAVGAGYGTVELTGDNASTYDKTYCSQYFLRLGVPVAPLFEIIGSVHNVFARVKAKNSDRLLEAGGILSTVGFAVGF